MTSAAPGRWLLQLALLGVANLAAAHGGVVMEKDVCKIKIGFYEAHFTVYEPKTRGNREFCEDLPDTGPSIFVLDYLHDSMKEVPLDFRIIHDATGLGRFARAEDIQALGDLAPQTIFYQPPTVEADGSLVVEPQFEQKGAYIGIVTAKHPSSDAVYSAVFPFTVGKRSVPGWLWAILAFCAPAAGALLLRHKMVTRTAKHSAGTVAS